MCLPWEVELTPSHRRYYLKHLQRCFWRIRSPWRLHVCDRRNCKTSPTHTRGEVFLSPYEERLKTRCWILRERHHQEGHGSYWMNRQLGYCSKAWQDKNLLRSSGLKQSLERPKYQILTLKEILPQLAKAKLFSTLDANDGFYQISLDGESSMKTAFWTPFGRWQYLRVSFGPCTRRNWMQAPWEVRWPSRGSGLSGHGIQREWRKCHSRPWQQSNLTSPKSKRNNPKLNQFQN